MEQNSFESIVTRFVGLGNHLPDMIHNSRGTSMQYASQSTKVVRRNIHKVVAGTEGMLGHALPEAVAPKSAFCRFEDLARGLHRRLAGIRHRR